MNKKEKMSQNHAYSMKAAEYFLQVRVVFLFLQRELRWCIHPIQKRLSSELLHCELRIVAYPDRTAPHHGCNEFLNSIAGAYYETATFVY